MIIDIHQHIKYASEPEFCVKKSLGSFSADDLLVDMDKWGIDKSVVLPLTNPENMDCFGVAGNHEVLRQCKKHSDRLIAFVNIDPRTMYNSPERNLTDLMKMFKDFGCRGIGELCSHLPIDGELLKNFFHNAGEMQLPVLFHLSASEIHGYGLIDNTALDGLQSVLELFPKTVFIGHAPAFWSAIDANIKEDKLRDSRPPGNIRNKGPLWGLMRKYKNLHADISANSGYNALTRDPEKGSEFLREFNNRIFYGTDMFYSKDFPPWHLTMLDTMLSEKQISRDDYDNITFRNFERVFGK